jgi:hypothetical protein
MVINHGIDLYREICCALGTDATFADYLGGVRSSGSKLDEPVLARLFDELHAIPFHVQMLSRCSFLHFGSTRQLTESGLELVRHDTGAEPAGTILDICTATYEGGVIDGTDAWIEGCCLRAPLSLAGRNVLVGVDVVEPFELPFGACLDLSPGTDRAGGAAWFVRYYGVDDTFKHAVDAGAMFCGQPLARWLRAAGVEETDVWSADTPAAERTLWNARVFPAEREHAGYRRWSWMLYIDRATVDQKRAFLAADRYSSAEIAVSVDQAAFHARRTEIRLDARRQRALMGIG